MNALIEHADFIEDVRLPELRRDLKLFDTTPCGEGSAKIGPEAVERLTRAIAEYEAIVDDIRSGRPA